MSNIVWEATLDDRYRAEVVASDDPYKGTLRLLDQKSGNKVMMERPTGIAYGAPFGADYEDVRRWQEEIVAFIDGGGSDA